MSNWQFAKNPHFQSFICFDFGVGTKGDLDNYWLKIHQFQPDPALKVPTPVETGTFSANNFPLLSIRCRFSSFAGTTPNRRGMPEIFQIKP